MDLLGETSRLNVGNDRRGIYGGMVKLDGRVLSVSYRLTDLSR